MKISISLLSLFLTFILSAQQQSSPYFIGHSCETSTDELELDGANDSKAVILLEGSFASIFISPIYRVKKFGKENQINSMFN